MLVALGFLAASLLGLLVASAFWTRAVRLTSQRIKQSMPVSEPEIKADRDRLRAEYAIKVHKLEMQLDQAKLERARQLIETNRRDASISTLETDVVQLKADLEENQNARRVLEQTVADKLPRVEARLNEAKRLLFNRDREIAELTAGAKRHKSALEEASSINAQQNAQIERLTTTLTTRGGRGRHAAAEAGPEGEVALRAELEQLRGKAREQAMLIDRLQRRLGHGYALAAPANGSSTEGEVTRAQRDIVEAETVINSVRAATADGETPAAPSTSARSGRSGPMRRTRPVRLPASRRRSRPSSSKAASRTARSRSRLGSAPPRRWPSSKRAPSPSSGPSSPPPTSVWRARRPISWARCGAWAPAARSRPARPRGGCRRVAGRATWPSAWPRRAPERRRAGRPATRPAPRKPSPLRPQSARGATARLNRQRPRLRPRRRRLLPITHRSAKPLPQKCPKHPRYLRSVGGRV